MSAYPFLGVFLHGVGGLAAGSFYLPYKRVRGWAWERYWITGGVFSWIVAPWIAAFLTSPRLLEILRGAPARSLFWTYILGLLWGVGGLTFGLSMRYLGLSLGMALALGFCAVFGTIVPPVFQGQFGSLASSLSGQITLAGVFVCLAGIAVCGRAGARREKEVPTADRKAALPEMNFVKGIWVAVFSGRHELVHGLRLGRRQADRRAGREPGDAEPVPELPGPDRGPGRRIHHQRDLVRHT